MFGQFPRINFRIYSDFITLYVDSDILKDAIGITHGFTTTQVLFQNNS
jgi:hypothetical protein